MAYIFQKQLCPEKNPSFLHYICRRRIQKSNCATLCSHFSTSAGHIQLYTPSSTLSPAQPVSTARYQNSMEQQHRYSDTPELHHHWDKFINTAKHWDIIFTWNDANEILNHNCMKTVILSSAKITLLGISICSKKIT